MTLRDLTIGQSAVITSVGGEGALRQHLLDMGVLPETEIKIVKYAPMGDPIEIRIHGYTLTLRLSEAETIGVQLIDKKRSQREASASHSSTTTVVHPGLGESGRFHDETQEHPLPKGARLTFALVGNQNCGKTTLFNRLTGANQHVGNFPGVTVDRKSGTIKGYPDTELVDLPGIYSLSPYSNEEIVSRQFILDEHPTCIINIVDATNIERNLYLTMQLMELNVPMVLALNMMDEVENNHGSININLLEERLGIPVVPISASKNQGVEELVKHAVHIAKYQETPSHYDFCDKDRHGGALHRCIHSIMHLIEDHAKAVSLPLRFAASKLVEGDALVAGALHLSSNECDMIDHIIRQMEEECGLDRAAAMADMRFAVIRSLCDATVIRPQVSKERVRSRRIDRVMTGKWTAIPVFVLIMLLIFWLTFDSLGLWLQEQLEALIAMTTDSLDALLTQWHVDEVVHSLVIDGICNGVGAVIGFLPFILLLFFFLSLLEDSGYMARIAFVMDKVLRKIGLSGRSIVPMLMGFGCSVPAVMATRTLPSERDRKLTILLTPFMSCTAKLPIYVFLIAAFFPNHGTWILIGIYLMGIVVGVVVALLTKNSLFRGEAVPFVMELPNYRMPGVRNVMQLLWDKARDFIQRAFSVIFIATIVIWFLQTFDFRFHVVTDSQDSMLAVVAGYIAPIFSPLGFGDWRVVTSLISGFMAKETVISTLSVLYGNIGNLQASLTSVSAFVLLVFSLLYTPCVAAIAAIRRELGGKMAFFIVIAQCLIAWVVAYLVKLCLMGFSIFL